MKITLLERERIGSLERWSKGFLARPVRPRWRIYAIIGASVLFFAIMGLLGGPTEGDLALSAYGTWAVAQGHLACLYPVASSYHVTVLADPFALAAPLYPVLSGIVYFALGLGGGPSGWPHGAALGGCPHYVAAMYNWSTTSGMVEPTALLGYLVWPVLLWGVLSVIRSTRYRWTMAEVAAVVTLGVNVPIVLPLVEFFHPQDILAMGLILLSSAALLRRRYLLAGVAVGLAIASQQFSVLVAAAIFMLLIGSKRWRYVAGAVLATLAIDVPLAIATSGRALKAALIGSSRTGLNVTSHGGSVLWEAHPHGVMLFAVSRLAPIVLAAAIGLWARRHYNLGNVLSAVPLLGVVTLALVSRLVFEENIFGYYFMAVALVLLDLVSGRLRGEVVAWVALVPLAFSPVHWGLFSNWTTWEEPLYFALPITFMLAAIASVLNDAGRHRVRIYKIIWIGLVARSCWILWFVPHSYERLPYWGWQLILVPTGIWLALTGMNAKSDEDDILILEEPETATLV